MNHSPSNACRRCGTCCRRGGPTLHTVDRALVVEGYLGPEDLVTIRAGEWAFHPTTQGLTELPSEIIKISGKDDTWSCRFLRESDHSCAIYSRRPLECRLLQCSDPGPVEAVFLRDLLTRLSLIPGDSALGELITAQEARFPAGLFYQLLSALRQEGTGGEASASLDHLLDVDTQFRQLVQERLGIEASCLDFYFGRPFTVLARKAKTLVRGDQAAS